MANPDKKKTPPTKTVPAVVRERKKKKEAMPFGTVIDTDRIRVTIDGSTIHYLIKATGEKLSKEYPNKDGRNHAARIIYGRISRDPHGEYAKTCVGKIRAANLKHLPI